MMKNLMRAALLALLPLCLLGSAVVTTPALAAQEKPSLSRALSKHYGDIQKAYNDKDWATLVTKCKEAQAIPDLSDFDKYILDRYLGLAYLNLNDHPSAEASIVAAVMSPAAPADERQQLLHAGMSLANEVNDYAKVIDLGKLAVQDGIADDSSYGEMAVASYNQKDYTSALDYAQKSVNLAVTAGKTPVYPVYQIMAICQDHAKDRDGAIKTLELMSRDYGKPDDWRMLLDFSIGQLPPGNRALAALDVFRLSMKVGATMGGPDYLAMADAANIVRSPGDAKRALETAVSSGALTPDKTAAAQRKAEADAKRDEPILGQAEAAAAKSGNAKEDLMVAEAYFGYGRYADATRVAKRALALGGAGAAEANLLLGMTLVMTGDEMGAVQSFDAVSGDAALARVAQLWKLYATRKYGRPEAAPAAPPAGH